jgi:hypothetical protein
MFLFLDRKDKRAARHVPARAVCGCEGAGGRRHQAYVDHDAPTCQYRENTI